MSDNNQGTSTEIAVAIGRIEEMIKSLFSNVKEQAISMRDLDERVRELERAIQRIEANQKPATPWWSVAGGIAGIGAIVIAIISLLDILNNTPTP